jgi:hypothetical protein
LEDVEARVEGHLADDFCAAWGDRAVSGVQHVGQPLLGHGKNIRIE